MGSKPKKQDYKPSESEKASADVAYKEYSYFKQKYDPLLAKMRDQSASDAPTRALRGRANADAMQALTTNMNLAQTQDAERVGDLSRGAAGQVALATKKGQQIQSNLQSGVLKTARGQAAQAQSGMAQASRLDTSENLTKAKAKADVKAAKNAAIAQIAGSALAQGLDNMATTGMKMPKSGVGPPQQVKGTFFNPVNSAGVSQGSPLATFGTALKSVF